MPFFPLDIQSTFYYFSLKTTIINRIHLVSSHSGSILSSACYFLQWIFSEHHYRNFSWPINRFWHLFSFLVLASFSGPAIINLVFCACLQSLTSFNKFFFNLTFNFSAGIICPFHLLWISFTLALISKWMVT